MEQGAHLPRTIFTVLSVTSHKSMANVTITILLYIALLLWTFKCPLKGSSKLMTESKQHSLHVRYMAKIHYNCLHVQNKNVYVHNSKCRSSAEWKPLEAQRYLISITLPGIFQLCVLLFWQCNSDMFTFHCRASKTAQLKVKW